MTSKEFLQKPMKIYHRIEQLRLKKQMYEELADSTPGGNYDKPYVQKTRSNQAPFIKWLDKIMDVDKEIETQEKEYKRVEAIVIAAIEKLPNADHQAILLMRYLNEYSWTYICEKLFVSLSTAKRWHWDAINALEYDENEVGP